MRLWHAMAVPLSISFMALAACSSKPTSTTDAFTASGPNAAGMGSSGSVAAGGASGSRPLVQAARAGARGGGAGGQATGGISSSPDGVTHKSAGGEAAGGTGQAGGRGDVSGSAAMGAGSTVHGNGSAAGDGSAGGAAGSAASAAGGASQTGAGLNGSSGSDASGTGGAGTAAGVAMAGGAGTADEARAAGGRRELAGFGTVPELRDVHFDYDAYHVRPADRAKLDAGAQWLRSNPKHVVLIEGHCDERGTQEYNLALGAHRAKSTMTYLIAQGIEPHRIQLISYGKERPVCTDDSDTCWSQNRRAHFLVKPE